MSGIECVGTVYSPSSSVPSKFPHGTKVAALMGGLGRTIPGSYAEYTRVPVDHVVPIDSDLSWEELAALPESYATAWTFIFRNLELQHGQTVLVRGGTSSLGLASINLAVNLGANVIATTRNLDRAPMLQDRGVQRVELEGPDLSSRLPEKKSIDAVLDLVGNSTLLDSLSIVRRGGRVCLGGWLGGLAPIKEFNPLLQMSSGVHFSLFASPHFGTEGFPVSDVPLQKIAEEVREGKYIAKPVKVFRFEDITEAHRFLEESGVSGKVVVKVGDN